MPNMGTDFEKPLTVFKVANGFMVRVERAAHARKTIGADTHYKTEIASGDYVFTKWLQVSAFMDRYFRLMNQ